MGLKIGRFLGKAARAVGKVARVAAPVLGATGIGLPLAAGIGLAGGALSKVGRGNLGDIAGSAVGGAAGGAAGSALNGSGILGRAVGLLRGAGRAGAAGGEGGGGGILDTIRSVGSSLGINNVRDLAELVGAGAAGVQGAGDMAGAERRRNQALDLATADYAARAPLRADAIRNLTNEPVRRPRTALADRGNAFSTGARGGPNSGNSARSAAASLGY
jgi:hypothetical protein